MTAKLVNQYFEHFNNHEWERMAKMYVPMAEFKDATLGHGIIKQNHAQIVEK
ncbi:hypothetical protein [Colwellia sp. TT2012]|uniref:hypothetical protein n=1 Tax=Colwellia sp. TT2012 TaxID=1720342 RepID=UPI000B0EA83A|nr:hypothetical protein [Colwellia sp. TT2012]